MTKSWAGLPVLLALLVAAGAASAQSPTIHRSTPAGQAVLVRPHVKLNQACQGSAPSISFSQNPAHGTVDIRPDRFVFGKGYVTGGLEACAGREVDGVAVWYTPAAGFHGTDQIAWTADFGGSGKHRRVDDYTAEITVQ